MQLDQEFNEFVGLFLDNASRVIQALAEFGFGTLGLTADDFNRRGLGCATR
jgi:hypothetical protein